MNQTEELNLICTYLIINVNDLLCHHQKSKVIFLLGQIAPLEAQKDILKSFPFDKNRKK